MRRTSLGTIERQIRALQAKAEKLKAREKTPVVREIVRLMRSHEISLAELSATNGSRRTGRKPGRSKLRGRKIKPMYRNPKTGETWTGRGRTARWIADLEKAGRKRDEFLIKKR
jgi:DNA-binding protein H-NS